MVRCSVIPELTGMNDSNKKFILLYSNTHTSIPATKILDLIIHFRDLLFVVVALLLVVVALKIIVVEVPVIRWIHHNSADRRIGSFWAWGCHGAWSDRSCLGIRALAALERAVSAAVTSGHSNLDLQAYS